MKNIITTGAFLIALVFGGCKRDDIIRFDAEKDSAVNFPGLGAEARLYPGYNQNDKTFYKTYSFLTGPSEATSAIVDLPVRVVGNAVARDRKVGFLLYEYEDNPASGFKVLEAVIPAGELYGHIRFQLDKTAKLDNEAQTLFVVLTDSEDLGRGINDYNKASLTWHNMLPMPALTTFKCRTYNFLINNGQSMNLATYAYYSSNAHLAILEALGWSQDPDMWPNYNSTAPINGLPMYTCLTNGIYYKLLKDYLDAYAASHDGVRLKHNAGEAIGQDIVARVW